jgi:uncharacterized Ntn-hydrolase superfamily protein
VERPALETRVQNLSSTFSLVALDAATGYLGSAVASCYFAVGSVVPHIWQGIGAVNSQHHHSHKLALRVLTLMHDGAAPPSALEAALAQEDQPELRQLLVIDVEGRKAAWTGPGCTEPCGHIIGETCVAAGNTLAGTEVVEAMARVMDSYDDVPFVLRMIRALSEGQARGGDRRGRQSAAVLAIPASEDLWESDYPDLRVDDSEDPLAELMRLYEKRWKDPGW